MTDIDFDELDKAVNSLVGNNKTSQAPDTPPAPASPPPTTKPFTPQPHKHSGSLIDVIHPAPSMTHSTSSSKPKKTLTPFHPDMTSSPQATPQSQPEPDDTGEDFSSSETQPSDWPDPLDAVPTPIIEQPQPPTSPFISGTKVEKRPLGTVADKKDVQEPEEDQISASPPEDSFDGREQDITPTDAIDETHRPEFGDELVKIESDETTQLAAKDEDEPSTTNFGSKTSSFSTPESDDSTPIEPKEEPSLSFKTDEKPTTASPAPPISGLLASSVVSIPQQYKKTPLTPEPHNDQPLFNADHYDQSSAHQGASSHHSSTKTTAWQWLLIIVGLLLLGAVLGTVVFVLVTGQSL